MPENVVLDGKQKDVKNRIENKSNFEKKPTESQTDVAVAKRRAPRRMTPARTPEKEKTDMTTENQEKASFNEGRRKNKKNKVKIEKADGQELSPGRNKSPDRKKKIKEKLERTRTQEQAPVTDMARRSPRRKKKQRASDNVPRTPSTSSYMTLSKDSDEKVVEKKKTEEEVKKEKEEEEKRELIARMRVEREKRKRMERDDPQIIVKQNLAQDFFKTIRASKKFGKRDNKKLAYGMATEVMPEARRRIHEKKKKTTISKSMSSEQEKTDWLRENGDPIWVVMTEDGQSIELDEALKEDGITQQDPKLWLKKIEGYFNGDFDDGKLEDNQSFSKIDLDPYAPFDVLEAKNATLYKNEALQYGTLHNLVSLNEPAVKRLSSNGGFDEAPTRSRDAKRKMSLEREQQERTAVESVIRFNSSLTFSLSYDRRRPILSIQKFRQRFLARQNAQKVVK